MKNEGIGHDIYDITRKLEPFLETKKEQYKIWQERFGIHTWNAIKKLNLSLEEWSSKAYDNAEAIRKDQYDNEGFKANLYAISSDITELSSQLRQNIEDSYFVGLSSITFPSEVALNIVTAPDEESLLNALSQISKYLTDIKSSYDNTFGIRKEKYS